MLRGSVGIGLALLTCGAGTALGAGTTVTIGDSGTPTSQIIADSNALALTAQGFTTTRVSFPSPFAADRALRAGEVDSYVTDSATLLRRVLARPAERRAARLPGALARPVAARKQAIVAWAPADEAPTVACTRTAVKNFRIGRLERLGTVSAKLTYAAPREHIVRSDGLLALRTKFNRVVVANGASRFTLLKRGKVHCVPSTATEPRLAGTAFITLRDSSRRLAATPARPITVASQAYLAGAPATFRSTLGAVAARYTTPRLRSARMQVEVRKQDRTAVARSVLVAGGISG